MKLGKVEEKVYKRSIGIYLPPQADSLEVGPGTGRDASFIRMDKDFFLVQSSATFVGKGEIASKWALAGALNNIYAAGGVPVSAGLMITLPEKLREINLKKMMSLIGEECKREGISITGGHTQISAAIEKPVVSVSACGRADKLPNMIKPGMDIVMCGYAGAAGTSVIACEKEQELKSYFNAAFIDDAIAFDKYRYVNKAAAVAGKSDAVSCHDGGFSGVFGTLWEMAERCGVGLEIDLRKILLRQETIEIAEYFDINPYELYSAGMLLVAANDGDSLRNDMLNAGIEAEIIGKTTSSNDRVLLGNEEERFLEPAKSDALYAMLTEY